jgi:hypothetical protein
MRFHAISSLGASLLPRMLASLLAGSAIVSCTCTLAQEGSGYYTDPATGVVYRKVQRTIERPIVETQMRTQESTVYRPETVVTSRPESRTVYNPVVSYGWEPKMTNRWNPFSQPTIVYQHTPRTHWEARTETIDRREAVTNWVAETRKVDVPQQIVRIQREEKVDYEPVGKVGSPSQATPPNSTEAAIAARLRPMDAGTRIDPLYPTTSTSGAYAASDAFRNPSQSGMRANELAPTPPPSYSMPLSPGSAGVGVAGVPMTPIWR